MLTGCSEWVIHSIQTISVEFFISSIQSTVGCIYSQHFRSMQPLIIYGNLSAKFHQKHTTLHTYWDELADERRSHLSFYYYFVLIERGERNFFLVSLPNIAMKSIISLLNENKVILCACVCVIIKFHCLGKTKKIRTEATNKTAD